jgi:hemerythrin-like domain-containing protein
MTAARFSRRAVLITGVGAIAVGAGGAELADHLRGGSSRPAADAPPDVDLMEEHGILKRVLLIYQAAVGRLEAGGEPPVEAIHGAALVVHDFIEAFHEALEEGYVFPLLRRAGELAATVDTLLTQHARGRQRTQMILATATTAGFRSPSTRAEVVDAIDLFVRMYQPHEAREDTVVFPAFRALCSTGQLDDLAQTFAGLQQAQFGAGAFEQVLSQVVAIEESLGIYDLDQYTPPALTP